MAIAPLSVPCRVLPRDPLLVNHVESIARATNRPARPVHLQALLQLPRCADSEGVVANSVVEPLLAELALELPAKTEWFVPAAGSSPRMLHFHMLDAGTARDVTTRFHYLRSPRFDGRAYGLSTRTGRLVAMCVSSPLDVVRLQELLVARGRSSKFARVVSRVFAFEGAPKNSISYMLSRVSREERRLGATDFVTYVNPNMGFTGHSYLASGWHALGIEPGTKYRYVDDRYITDRELAARFSECDDETLRRTLGRRFAASIMHLAPLLVFHTRLVQAT